jgi:hypothetical protein
MLSEMKNIEICYAYHIYPTMLHQEVLVVKNIEREGCVSL